MMQMIGSFAEFERAMLRERPRAGLESARDEGRIGGRRTEVATAAANRGCEDGLSRKEDRSGFRSTFQCSSRDDLPAACAERRRHRRRQEVAISDGAA